jgi:hypothetical protein
MLDLELGIHISPLLQQEYDEMGPEVFTYCQTVLPNTLTMDELHKEYNTLLQDSILQDIDLAYNFSDCIDGNPEGLKAMYECKQYVTSAPYKGFREKKYKIQQTRREIVDMFKSLNKKRAPNLMESNGRHQWNKAGYKKCKD